MFSKQEIKSRKSDGALRQRDQEFTFASLFSGTTNKLDSAEDVNPAGEQHCKASELHTTVRAGSTRGWVPLIKIPALCLVVDVIKETMFRNKQSVGLERSF